MRQDNVRQTVLGSVLHVAGGVDAEGVSGVPAVRPGRRAQRLPVPGDRQHQAGALRHQRALAQLWQRDQRELLHQGLQDFAKQPCQETQSGTGSVA